MPLFQTVNMAVAIAKIADMECVLVKEDPAKE